MNDTLEYIGTLSRAKGFRGEIILKDTQKGIKTITPGSELLIGYSKNFAKRYQLKLFSSKQKYSILSVEGYESEESINSLLEKAVFTERSNINAEKKDQPTLTEDIIGVTVFDNNSNETIGTVVDIIYAPGNDVWVIEPVDDLPDILFPAVSEFVHKFDKNNNSVTITLPDGIRDL
jgi:16S rRNA processing protein RimM